MKGTGKLLAGILSLTMLLSLMPAMAFADIESDAPEAAAAEEIIENDAEEPAAEEASAEEAQDTAAASDDETYSGDAVSDEKTAVPEEDPEEESDEEYDEDEFGVGYEELSFSAVIDPDTLEDADAEELVEEYLLSDEPEEEDELAPVTPLSVKGDRLTGNSLKFYNYLKGIIKTVYAANTSSASMKTYKSVKLSKIIGKRTFTAKELGVKKIGYIKNGKWYVTAAAQKKITALLADSNWSNSWKKIYTSLLSDLSLESYWVDWYSESNPNNQHYRFIEWDCPYSYNSKKLVFDSSDTITFRLPVIRELRYSGSEPFKASTSKIKGTAAAKEYAKSIVKTVDDAIPQLMKDYGYTAEQTDIIRMMYYCEKIAEENTYDTEAAQYNAGYKGGPWSLIPVFDKDPSTNVVCVGYARAFKYLCDLSKFKSNWIDCQFTSGDADGGHMWNIVRMHDGQNYLVDPTWMDKDSTGEIDWEWFLRGKVAGDANSFTIACTYGEEPDTYTNYYYRKYEDWVTVTFPPAERRLSNKSYYNASYISVLPIALKRPVIKKPARGKKSFTAKWKKASPIGALYVDGYQIRYSKKKSMKGAKKVTVKGFARTSRKIKKLKKKKYYYIQVRSYAKLGGKTYYSPWSKKKRVKTK